MEREGVVVAVVGVDREGEVVAAEREETAVDAEERDAETAVASVDGVEVTWEKVTSAAASEETVPPKGNDWTPGRNGEGGREEEGEAES